MTIKFEQELYEVDNGKNFPPSWANEATFYFENSYGEQWIAKRDKDKLYISGMDIGWKEIIVNYQQLNEYVEFQKEAMLATSEKKFNALLEKIKKSENPLFRWGLNESERFWVMGVCYSVMLELQYYKEVTI